MKNLVLTALLSCIVWAGKAQNTIQMETQQQDSLAITKLLEGSYFKGIFEGDVALLATVFHPGTLLFGDVKGQPYAKTLPLYLDGVKNRQSPKASGKPFKGEILSIKLVNSIAIAEVRVTMYDFVYHEFLSFHKIDGRWFLVNKMITDTSGQAVGKDGFKTPSTGAETILVAYIDILPGFEKEVRDALAVMAAESKKEPGCIQFEANTRIDSPRSIVIYEVYVTDEAFQLHRKTPHATKFFEFLKGKMVNDKIEVTLLSAVNPSK